MVVAGWVTEIQGKFDLFLPLQVMMQAGNFYVSARILAINNFRLLAILL